MKNYYEILEINQNASQEIVEKAYKVLAKKYHPDLQITPEDKKKCEEKIKQINEAYDVISNIELRKEYDDKLQMEYNMKIQQQEEQIRKHYQNQQNENISQPTSNMNNEEFERRQEQIIRQNAERERQYREAVNKAYHDAYIQDLKNRGYKIKYKRSFSDYLHSLVALLITIGIIFLILQLPFVKDYFWDLYNKNDIIKMMVDFFMGLFK